jgi:hypothetical protein
VSGLVVFQFHCFGSFFLKHLVCCKSKAECNQ